MPKKKVTLSIDDKIYDNFKEHCEENAIMLSKKIELIMEKLTKDKSKKSLGVFILFGIFFISFASATAIFSDGFESGTLNNWTVTNTAGTWHANNTGPIDPPLNNWHMITSNSVGVRVTSERNVSTVGYQNITFDFYYKGDTNLLDSPESLTAEWFDGTAWTVILNITGGSVPTTYTLSSNSLNSAANNNTNFKIRLECQSNLGTEGCAIDNVTITGNIIDSNPPTITLNSPANNSNFASIGNIILNATSNDAEASTLAVRFFGDDYTGSGPGNDALIYENSVSNGSIFTYNWTTPVITSSYMNTSGLVLLFHLDNRVEFGESTGAGGTVYDFSGLENNGSNNGATGVTGKVGNALHFNSSVHINMSNSASLNISGTEITVTAWIKIDSINTANLFNIILTKGQDSNAQYRLALNRDNGKLLFRTPNVSGTVETVTIPSFDTWYHLAGTYNGTAMLIYLNGVLENSIPQSGNIITNTNNLFIGKGNINSQYFNGTIDEVSLWNRSLSSSEILDLYRLKNSTYKWYATSNDGSNTNTSGTRQFSVGSGTPDIIPPTWVVEPQNQTINETQSFQYDIEASDNIAIDKYFINDNVNFSINQSGFIQNISVLNVGNYTLNVSVNDTSNNILSKVIIITVNSVDNSPPQFSSISENPSNNSNYTQGQFYEFNITVTEPNLATIKISFDGTNYTDVYARGGGVYSFNRTNLAAETYDYYWWANDTSGNSNSSETRSYTISKTMPSLSLSVTNVTYPSDGVINASENNLGDSDLIYNLFISGVLNSSGSNINLQKDFAVGNYTIEYNTTGGQNYTSVSTTKQLIISQGSSEVNTFLNNSRSNTSIFTGDSIYLNGTLVSGQGTIELYLNGILINSGISPLSNLTVFNSQGMFNVTTTYSGNMNYTSSFETWWVNVTQAPDTTSPTWVIEPQNQTINETQFFAYDIEATDDIAIDKYSIDDNFNFSINQSGFIQNITSLQVGNYTLNISVNDASNNILSKVIRITVNSIPANFPPTIYSNLTLVNGSSKIPEFDDSFIIQVNLSDPENNTINFVNFTITAPNGTEVVDNVKGSEFLSGIYSIWNSTNYTIDDYGVWNWSYVLSDGANLVNGSGSFRVYSEVFVFPASYFESPDPYNKTLVWNLSLYHLSLENYTLNFTFSINQTYFNLTLEKNSVVVNKAIYNSSNLFKNLVTIETNSSTPVGSYLGQINITRQEDGKIFTVPIQIGINPPSGNIDALNLSSGVQCLNGNCDINVEMENDEINSFSWKLKNNGNHTLSECAPSVTGFNLSKFGNFSNTNFTLNVSEELTLTLNINKPTINSYYGELEVVCKATPLGFNNSLGAERENVPSLTLIVKADSGNPPEPPTGGGSSSGGGSGGSSSGGAVIPLKTQISAGNISNIILNEGGVKKIAFWRIKNFGNTFLNDCRFSSKGENQEWITYKETRGLAVGEEYEFVFDINIPKVDAGRYNLEVELNCKETSASKNFVVEIVERGLKFSFVNIEREGKDRVKVDYNIEELFGKDQEVELEFLLFDVDNKQVAELREIKNLNAETTQGFTSLIPIDELLEGQMTLLVNLNSDTYSGFVQENIVLGSSISGFTIIDRLGGRDNLMSILFVLLFLAFVFFVIKSIKNHKKIVEEKVRHMVREHRKIKRA